jgi:alcohol dehydrogenase class IV
MPACFEKIASFASFLGVDRKENSVRETAEQVPLEILQLMGDLDLPTTLKQVNFPKSDLTSFAEYIVNERQFVYDLPRYNPRKLTAENMNELLNEMYEGSLER